jgi:endonuclease/exonuclease/phosphatase family metal-dependent hydrolase
MTYNIRYDDFDKTENSWINRKEPLTDLLTHYTPDIIGTQEGLKNQLEDIKAQLPGYQYVGIGRDSGDDKGEHTAIFYNGSKLECLYSSTFWLSNTPEVPSKGWDAAFNRICTYALFRLPKIDQQLWVFNLHLDHIGSKARLESINLLLDKIHELQANRPFPVIVMGDLNAEPSDPPIIRLKDDFVDGFDRSRRKPYGPIGTYNAFDFSKKVERRIDYIFVQPDEVEVLEYSVIDDFQDFRYPSDHLPVLVKASFPENK